ncbi:MAG: hypothetical protein NTW29_20745 [Bacteroidetes bacterium]|nr:hypothetical protein [Bacteroidota bacterium]
MLNNSKQIGWALALIFCISAGQGYGQAVANSYGEIKVEIIKANKPKSIYAKVEITRSFPGGDTAWTHSLEKRLERDLPFRNGARKGRYFVSVAFIVLKDGSVAEVRCISDPGYGMGETVVRAIIKGPRWTPAPPGGIKVREVHEKP